LITILGHLAIDNVIDRRGDPLRTALGGPISYCSLALKSIQFPFTVVTKIGDDFPSDYIDFLRENAGLDLGRMKRSVCPTTRFIIDRSKEPREMHLESKCEAFDEDDLLAIRASPSSRGTLLVDPIAGEISTVLLKELSSIFQTTIIDSQGFVRRFESDGLVTYRQGIDLSCLDKVDYMKADRAEATAWTGKDDLNEAIGELCKHSRHVILTAGRGPVAIYTKGHRILSARPFPVQVADTTGAGDILIGLFSAGKAQGRGDAEALKLGVGGSTLAVGSSGIGKAILHVEELRAATEKVVVTEF
jgi:sugar/nucleoside kinase (ribokinase family)